MGTTTRTLLAPNDSWSGSSLNLVLCFGASSFSHDRCVPRVRGDICDAISVLLAEAKNHRIVALSHRVVPLVNKSLDPGEGSLFTIRGAATVYRYCTAKSQNSELWSPLTNLQRYVWSTGYFLSFDIEVIVIRITFKNFPRVYSLLGSSLLPSLCFGDALAARRLRALV